MPFSHVDRPMPEAATAAVALPDMDAAQLARETDGGAVLGDAE